MKPNNPHPSSLIIDHLDTWSSVIKAKSSAGRGGGKKQEFYGIKKLDWLRQAKSERES